MSAPKLPSTAQAVLLRAIAAGGDLSTKALAEASGKAPNNISRDLDGLAIEGWLFREPGSPPELTVEGREVLAALDRFEGKGESGPVAAEFPLDLIDADPLVQPRKAFDDAELEELAESIREKGVFQPILLRQGAPDTPDRRRIVTGERRVRASRLAGRETIPFVYRELTDSQASEIALIENVQRADLNPIEEAEGFRKVIDTRMVDEGIELKVAKLAIADATGKSVRHIEYRLDLLLLPDGVQKKIIAGEMGMREARQAVQNLRDIERRAKERELEPASLLIMAEVFAKHDEAPSKVQIYTYGEPEKFAEIQHTIDGVTIVANHMPDAPDGTPFWSLKSRHALSVHAHTDGRTYARLGYMFSKDDLERQLPGITAKATRQATLDALRLQVLGLQKLADIEPGAWATPWLNGPFEPEPTRAAKGAQAAAEKAEREARQAAENEARQARMAAAAAQRELDFGDEGRELLRSTLELETAVAAGLSHDGIKAAVETLLARRGFRAPFTLSWNGQHLVRQDADGKPIEANGPAFEAIMRLINIGVNVAAAAAFEPAQEIVTDWHPRATIKAESLEQFIGWIAERLLNDHDVLDDAARAVLAEGIFYANHEHIAFGAEHGDWTQVDADTLADEEMDSLAADPELTFEQLVEDYRQQLVDMREAAAREALDDGDGLDEDFDDSEEALLHGDGVAPPTGILDGDAVHPEALEDADTPEYLARLAGGAPAVAQPEHEEA